jgi:ribonuclease P protein component
MLKKTSRLLKQKDFERVLKSGQSTHNQTLGIKAIKNNFNQSRFGIIISTKVSKKAVIRNKIKRQIRAIIKTELKDLKTDEDIVIITFPKITEKKLPEIKSVIKNGFNKLNLYNQKP